MQSSLHAGLDILEPFTRLLPQSGVVFVSGLLGVAIVASFIGYSHAADREESPDVRILGGLLIALSIAILGVGVYAVVQR